MTRKIEIFMIFEHFWLLEEKMQMISASWGSFWSAFHWKPRNRFFFQIFSLCMGEVKEKMKIQNFSIIFEFFSAKKSKMISATPGSFWTGFDRNWAMHFLEIFLEAPWHILRKVECSWDFRIFGVMQKIACPGNFSQRIESIQRIHFWIGLDLRKVGKLVRGQTNSQNLRNLYFCDRIARKF